MMITGMILNDTMHLVQRGEGFNAATIT
jgi:hypothetical protein